MKNLVKNDLDKLEDSPKSTPVRERGIDRHHYRGIDCPYKKIHSFLTHRVGKHWDDVFSEFVHLEWLPKQYRTKEQFANDVLTHTFMKDGKVAYYDKYCGRTWDANRTLDNERLVEDYGRDTFYIHPKSRLLCFYQHKKVDYNKKRKEEEAKKFRILSDYHQLIKRNGVWHEVKGKPVESDVVVIDGLHYKKVKSVASVETIKKQFLQFSDNVVVNKPDQINYKIIDGQVLIPITHSIYHRYSKDDKIGPRDLMIDGENYSKHDWLRKNYNTLKIVFCRQLNKKQLKKYGLKNDVKLLNPERCKKCGGVAGINCWNWRHNK